MSVCRGHRVLDLEYLRICGGQGTVRFENNHLLLFRVGETMGTNQTENHNQKYDASLEGSARQLRGEFLYR
jgi:hypothetical protein